MRTSDASGNIRLGYRLAAYTAVLFAVVGFMVLSAAPAAAQETAVAKLLSSAVEQAINWGRWAVIIIVIWRIVKLWKDTKDEFPFMAAGKIILAGVIILYFMSWQGLRSLTTVGVQAGADLTAVAKTENVPSGVFTTHKTTATTTK